MKPEVIIPFVHRTIRKSPTILTVATAATGIIRQMAIKRYVPHSRHREISLRNRFASLHAVHCQIFREKGSGATPTIVIAGFVPDSTEVVEFQRAIFKNHGDIYYINYPRTGFSTEMFSAQLADLIEEINNKGEKPVLFGISFGGGLLTGFLQEEISEGLRIRGVVLVSPVLCTEDLVRPEKGKSGGVRMIESNLRRILKADADSPEDINRQIERARRCFQALFEAGAENRRLTSRHLSIKKKIMEVLQKTTFIGGYERVVALKQFTMPAGSKPVFTGPALTLLAEMEENVLVPTSPSLAVLRNCENYKTLFPNGTLRHVASTGDEDAVAHASLIFHHRCFNPHFESWYGRLHAPKLLAVL
jgi:pimeloyl-ACP methyl ester carboxylesterase